jgi:hypothetical protein
MVQESKYEALDRYITRAMPHAESVFFSNTSTAHHGLQTLGSRQVQSNIGIYVSSEAEYMKKNDTLLDYYIDRYDVEEEFDVSLNLWECIRQINNARSKLKGLFMNARELRTHFELELAIAVVEHKMPEFHSGETFMECDKDALVHK